MASIDDPERVAPLHPTDRFNAVWAMQKREPTPEPAEDKGHLLPDADWKLVQYLAGDDNG